jgi:Domain of unknown function (DUF4281)
MTADFLFSMANPLALTGWLTLIAGVVLNRPFLRDDLAGRWLPLGFSLLYSLLIILFFAKAEGGFDTLANVQRLFTSPWAALAGWVHYLAFDLFVGAWIARGVMERGMSRWLLLPLLPLTFMFGPMGLAGFELAKLTFGKSENA